MLSRPQTIFLDAVGTLFGVRGTVGQIYGEFAAQAGVAVNDEALDRAFIESFRAAPRAAFPGVEPTAIPELEFRWWFAIARQTFTKVGVIEQFNDFGSFFRILFDHFAQATPWTIYPEVPEMLAYWQQQGVQLGVISNFDSRLYPVLEALDLAQYFESVTISTTVGTAKPTTGIFTAALTAHQCTPAQAWHIGDSWTEDYQGAERAGIQGIWLNRDRQPLLSDQFNAVVISDLSALHDVS